MPFFLVIVIVIVNYPTLEPFTWRAATLALSLTCTALALVSRQHVMRRGNGFSLPTGDWVWEEQPSPRIFGFKLYP